MQAVRPLILQPDSEPYGACRALLRSIEAMPPGSVRPLVVFPYEGPAVGEYEAAGCDVDVAELAVLRRSAAGAGGLLRLVGESRRTGVGLAELARSQGCDLVHTNSMTILSGIVAARRARIPHVWQLREAPRERGIRARVLRRLLGRADLVLAVSRAAAELAPRGCARVIHDGYDLPVGRRTRHSAIAQRGELLVGMVGRVSPTKAQHVALSAMRALEHAGRRDVRLVIAGTVYRGYEQYAQDEVVMGISRLDRPEQVHVIGWLEDPEALLGQTDVLVTCTAAGEGFGSSVLEAMAHGVPVVSCATGGVEELVLHEQTGLVVEPGDAQALAAALARLADDEPFRARLGAGAAAHAARWSQGASAARLLGAWADVVRG